MMRKEYQRMSKTVLIIDDSPTVRVIIEQQLQRLALTTRSFAGGIEAFQWLTTSQEIPDFFLIDVNLPKLNGYEIVRRLRLQPRYSTTRIALMSSGDIARDRLRGTGTTYFLHKPFTIPELISVIHTALAPLHTSLHHDSIGEGKYHAFP
jgi:CheY-like chemotaxis protein